MRVSAATATLSAGLIGLSIGADGQAATDRMQANIPPESLGPALRSLAQALDFQVVYASKDVTSRRTRGATGEFTPDEALQKVLAGTGMTFRRIDRHTVTIVPIGNTSGHSGEKTMTKRKSPFQRIGQQLLKAASVSAAVSLALRGGLGYAQTATTDGGRLHEVIVTATRRAENIQDVPVTIQAFTGNTLAAANITSLDDLLRYTPNVTFSSQGPGQSVIYMRGMGGELRQDVSGAAQYAFPNVAIYLNDESMQFPARNVDVYMVDMERVEVDEGPQGTLFGGGAEAGAIRYITNRPKYNVFEGHAEAGYGFTDHGDPSNSENLTLNIPLVDNELAARLVIYNEREGGYIDNVPSTFTRSNNDQANYLLNIKPGANGLCPNGMPAGSGGFCALGGAPQANNYDIAANAQNATTYSGLRFSLQGQITDDWGVLITQSLSDLDAEGVYFDEPVGSDFQPLPPLSVTTFSPSYDHDRWESTAWTVNGQIGDIKLLYTGAYTNRHATQQMDYTNSSRGTLAMYYQCTGGSSGWGSGPPICYSPIAFWHDFVHNTHLTEEFRVSTPGDRRLRALGGAYYEDFRIYEEENYFDKTIPDCNSTNLTASLAGGPPCVADVGPIPGSANEAGNEFGQYVHRGYTQTAAYGSLDYDIVPRVLTVTGGTRWYQYRENESGPEFYTWIGCMNVPNGQCAGSIVPSLSPNGKELSATYTGFINRAGVTWHVNRDVMAYFTFSQGYRPGGFNIEQSKILKSANGAPQYLTPIGYSPDHLTNYEIGVKSELLNRTLLLNLSAYYMMWSDVQQSLTLLNFGFPFGSEVNGASYDIKGFEVQFVSKPLMGVTLQGSATYNRTSQSNSPCLVGNISGAPSFGQCITTAVPVGSSTVAPFSNPYGMLGASLPFAPSWQANVHARYDWTVGDYYPWVLAGVSYTGGMYNYPVGTPSCVGAFMVPNTIRQRCLTPSYYTLDGSIGAAKGSWTIGIYGANLANSRASRLTAENQWTLTETPVRPRTIGIKFSVTF